MNRLLVYTITLFFLAATTVFAVEKKEKKQVNQQEVDKKKVTKQAQSKPGYDDFVDRNNNGIDDRVESRKKKAGADKKPIEDSVKKEETKPKSK